MRKDIRFILFSLLLFLLGGCVDLTLLSVWRGSEIAIDGIITDWKETLVKEQNVAFGACNDAENMYLCLSITDKTTKAQLMGLFKQDFYIWFDPQGKKSRTFGIKFSNNSAFMDEDLLTKIQHLRVQQFQVIADEMMKNLIIQVMQNNYNAVLLSDAKGINAGVGISKNGRELTYELKIPLVKSEEHPYAIGVIPGKPVYVGLQTSPIDITAIRKQNIEDEPKNENTVGRAGIDGRGHRRRNMPAGENGGTAAETVLEKFRPVQIWCKIIIAKKS